MLQTIPRWKVHVLLDSNAQTTVWIYDNHIANVLRQVASMQLTENGLDAPIVITVSRAML